jgi:hypothetical protein
MVELIVMMLTASFIIIAIIHGRRLRLAQELPFLALTPGGIVASRSGKPKDFRTISWDQVKNRLKTVGAGWTFWTGVIRELKIGLQAEHAKEFHRQMLSHLKDGP